jgi:hypothetical protein
MKAYQLAIDFIDTFGQRYVTLMLVPAASFDAAMEASEQICSSVGGFTDMLPVVASLAENVDFIRPSRVPQGSGTSVIHINLESDADPVHGRTFMFSITLPSPLASLIGDDGVSLDTTAPTFALLEGEILSKLCDVRANSYNRTISGLWRKR